MRQLVAMIAVVTSWGLSQCCVAAVILLRTGSDDVSFTQVAHTMKTLETLCEARKIVSLKRSKRMAVIPAAAMALVTVKPTVAAGLILIRARWVTSIGPNTAGRR